MGARVLVRSSERQWDLILLIVVGFAGLLVSVLVGAAGNFVPAGLLAVGGFALIFGTAIGWYRRVRTRLWVEDQGDGFLLADYDGERRLPDSQVLSSALIMKKNYSQGLLKSTTRRFVVWLATDNDRPERVELRNDIPLNSSDPLGAFVNRINGRLTEQAKQDLEGGRSVLGECWAWEGSGLTLREGVVARPCTVADVTAVDLVDGKICIWKRGQDDAYARVPVDSANAYVLWQLLADHIAKQPKDESGPPPGQLGRIIFERAPSKGTTLFVATIAICSVIVAAALAFAGLKGDEILFFWAVVALLVGGGFGLGALHSKRSTFRCHEYGVYQAGLTGSRQLQYVEVGSFTYAATRHFHNGVYTGTAFSLSFEPVPERAGNRIAYSTTMQNADEELDNLREHIARVIAGRMVRDIKEGKVVEWTANLRFRPEGIEYRPSGFFGRKDPLVIAWADIVNYDLQQGVFHLWVRGKEKSIVQEQVSQPNFFPGFVVLMAMFSAGNQE